MPQTPDPGVEHRATLPRLRRDLVLSPQGGGDTTALIVKDPATAKFYRFRQVEAFVLQKLDGKTALDSLRPEVERAFGLAILPATLEQFVDKLQRLGLLAKDEDQPAMPPAPRRRTGGTVLYLRLSALDPDRLLARLERRLRFCFTPAFVVASCLVILIGAGISVSNSAEILGDIIALWSFKSLLLAWVVVTVAITAHEFAHGLTCKHFGGSVHELGFLLLYFQPAFYCNVSDAWLFPQKSRRLWVSFAGAYCDLLIWALATIAWRITEFSTGLSHIALIIMGTTGIRTLFNLNPLIKLDGYYLLSDYLEIPNLRARAMAFLKRQASNATRRERRIYLVYGLLAWTYSTWLLVLVARWFGGWLVDGYQAWGFFAFVGLLAAIFRKPLVAGFARVKTAPMKKHAKILAVVVVGVVTLFFTRMELKVAGEFKVLPLHNADIRAEVEGIIEDVRVDEGVSVAKGDLIGRLSERDNRAELRKVTAQIEEKQAQLEMLRAGPRQEEIAVARTTVEKDTERVRFARSQFDLLKPLHAQGIVSEKEFNEAEEEATVRQKELEEAEGKLNVLLAGSRPEEIQALEAEVGRLDVQQRYLQDQLERVNLVSPISGVVTTPKLKEKIGVHVNKGDLVATVHELKTVLAEIAMSEKEISDVRVGATVVLKARAYPQQIFEGKVTAIAPTVTKTKEETRQADRTVTVTTQLDNADLLLKPEMTGTAKIYCGKRRLLDLVTRRLSRYVRVEFWSWW